jgi:hypothetical protein
MGESRFFIGKIASAIEGNGNRLLKEKGFRFK